jgi:hypothetical protein
MGVVASAMKTSGSAWVESLLEVWYDLPRHEAENQGGAMNQRSSTECHSLPPLARGDASASLRSATLARRSDLPVQKSQWVFRHWARRGVALNGNPRHRVKLPCVKIGRVRYTSIEALREFIASLNRAAK